MENDDLDALIAKRTARNAAIPAMVEAARQRRVAERETVARRERLGYPDTGQTAGSGHIDAYKLLPRSERHERLMPTRAVRRND